MNKISHNCNTNASYDCARRAKPHITVDNKITIIFGFSKDCDIEIVRATKPIPKYHLRVIKHDVLAYNHFLIDETDLFSDIRRMGYEVKTVRL